MSTAAIIDSALYDTAGERLPLADAELFWYPHFISRQHGETLMQALLEETPWRQDELRIHGRVIQVPRLQAWYGDAGARYGYSGLTLEPLPFTPRLTALREQLQDTLGLHFNAVLLNYYRNGSDSVSWHSDDEPELGPEPLIASMSLGEERRFELKHRTRTDLGKFALPLTGCSLLVMGKGVQKHWKHQIPKQPGISGARLNLTFRLIA